MTIRDRSGGGDASPGTSSPATGRRTKAAGADASRAKPSLGQASAGQARAARPTRETPRERHDRIMLEINALMAEIDATLAGCTNLGRSLAIVADAEMC